jgi:hypothetical protein
MAPRKHLLLTLRCNECLIDRPCMQMACARRLLCLPSKPLVRHIAAGQCKPLTNRLSVATGQGMTGRMPRCSSREHSRKRSPVASSVTVARRTPRRRRTNSMKVTLLGRATRAHGAPSYPEQMLLVLSLKSVCTGQCAHLSDWIHACNPRPGVTCSCNKARLLASLQHRPAGQWRRRHRSSGCGGGGGIVRRRAGVDAAARGAAGAPPGARGLRCVLRVQLHALIACATTCTHTAVCALLLSRTSAAKGGQAPLMRRHPSMTMRCLMLTVFAHPDRCLRLFQAVQGRESTQRKTRRATYQKTP